MVEVLDSDINFDQILSIADSATMEEKKRTSSFDEENPHSTGMNPV